MAVPAVAQAAPIASDGFEDYALGQLEAGSNGADGVGGNAGTGWPAPNEWDVANGSKTAVTILGTGLDYASGQINIDGGDKSLQMANAPQSNALLSRSFAPTAGTVYLSFLFRTSSVNIAEDDFFQIGLDNNADNPGASVIHRRTAADTGNYDFRARTGTGSNETAFSGNPSAANEVYFLVLRVINPDATDTGDSVTMFRNPSSLTEGSNPSLTVSGASGLGGSIDDFVVRTALGSGNETFTIDEVRIGSTFADVVPEPGAVLGLALGVPLLGLARRRRAARR